MGEPLDKTLTSCHIRTLELPVKMIIPVAEVGTGFFAISDTSPTKLSACLRYVTCGSFCAKVTVIEKNINRILLDERNIVL
jgi:hypothetical protein